MTSTCILPAPNASSHSHLCCSHDFPLIPSHSKNTTLVPSKPFSPRCPHGVNPPPGPSTVGRSSFGRGWDSVAKSTEGPKILAPGGSGCRNHMGHGGSLPLLCEPKNVNLQVWGSAFCSYKCIAFTYTDTDANTDTYTHMCIYIYTYACIYTHY